jgi:lycopene cyclase domain-containing protein
VDRYQYLLLLAACLAATLPLELLLRAGVYRRWRRLLRALLPVVAIFSAWDVAAIAWGHWSYNPRYVTGWQLPGRLPFEELAFFVVVPLCGLLTFEAVRRLRGR